MKELRFHPQFRTLLFTTAEDSFNVFRPNLDPDYEPQDAQAEPEQEDEWQEVGQALLPPTKKLEEEKQGSSAGETTETSNQHDKEISKRTEYAVDTDEDMEDEERRIIATARQLNKQRAARSRSKAKGQKRKRI